MTKFIKDQFTKQRASIETWCHYTTDEGERIFISRFKYGNNGRRTNHFIKALIKHVSVEQFKEMSHSELDKFLEARGYLDYNLGLACKRYGFPATQAGWNQTAEQMRLEREAREAAA